MKTTKDLRQDILCPGRHSNQAHPEYISIALPLDQQVRDNASNKSKLCLKRNKQNFKFWKYLKSAIFWVATPYSSERTRRFGGTYRLHFQCRRVRQTKYQ
jgi:hypothetical protein